MITVKIADFLLWNLMIVQVDECYVLSLRETVLDGVKKMRNFFEGKAHA